MEGLDNQHHYAVNLHLGKFSLAVWNERATNETVRVVACMKRSNGNHKKMLVQVPGPDYYTSIQQAVQAVVAYATAHPPHAKRYTHLNNLLQEANNAYAAAVEKYFQPRRPAPSLGAAAAAAAARAAQQVAQLQQQVRATPQHTAPAQAGPAAVAAAAAGRMRVGSKRPRDPQPSGAGIMLIGHPPAGANQLSSVRQARGLGPALQQQGPWPVAGPFTFILPPQQRGAPGQLPPGFVFAQPPTPPQPLLGWQQPALHQPLPTPGQQQQGYRASPASVPAAVNDVPLPWQQLQVQMQPAAGHLMEPWAGGGQGSMAANHVQQQASWLSSSPLASNISSFAPYTGLPPASAAEGGHWQAQPPTAYSPAGPGYLNASPGPAAAPGPTGGLQVDYMPSPDVPADAWPDHPAAQQTSGLATGAAGLNNIVSGPSLAASPASSPSTATAATATTPQLVLQGQQQDGGGSDALFDGFDTEDLDMQLVLADSWDLDHLAELLSADTDTNSVAAPTDEELQELLDMP